MAQEEPPATAAAMPPWINRLIITIILWAALALLAYSALRELRGLVSNLVIALFLSFALEPAVNWLHKHGWRRGLATGAPRLEIVSSRPRRPLEIEQHGRQVDPRDAIDHRMVRLEDQGKAARVQPLHDPVLPERPRAVETLGGDPPCQQKKLLLRPRRRERSVADVILEIEVRVVDP